MIKLSAVPCHKCITAQTAKDLNIGVEGGHKRDMMVDKNNIQIHEIQESTSKCALLYYEVCTIIAL